MIELTESEREILFVGRDLMSRLIEADDWLPPEFSAAEPACARQFQLYVDAMERFSIVSTVLAPGQSAPIADEPFWQIFGVLRGSLARRRFELDSERRMAPGEKRQRLAAGAVATSSAGGAAQLENLLADGPAIAIQVYGGEIGKIPRWSRTPEGAGHFGPTGYANAPDTPPYDIWTIQTRIED